MYETGASKVAGGHLEQMLSKWVRSAHSCWPMVVCTVVALAIWFDIDSGGFGVSNGRAISLLDSVDSAMKTYAVVDLCSGRWMVQGRLSSTSVFLIHFIAALLVKFGPSSALSCVLGQTPVLLKGPRHFLSFTFAFALVALSPVYPHFRNQRQTALLFLGASSLFKARKLVYTLQQAAHVYDAAFVVVLGVSAVEGSTVMRWLLRCTLAQRWPSFTGQDIMRIAMAVAPITLVTLVTLLQHAQALEGNGTFGFSHLMRQINVEKGIAYAGVSCWICIFATHLLRTSAPSLQGRQDQIQAEKKIN